MITNEDGSVDAAAGSNEGVVEASAAVTADAKRFDDGADEAAKEAD